MRVTTSPPFSRRNLSRAMIGFPRIGIDLREREVLELVLHRAHADALGERRIDIHRLARDAQALLGALDVMQRAHVVKPVGELHQQDADILRHGDDELAEILRLARDVGLRLQLEPRELGDAVDQPRDLRPEQPLDLLDRGERVLDRVVQQCRDDRRRCRAGIGSECRRLRADARNTGRPKRASARRASSSRTRRRGSARPRLRLDHRCAHVRRVRIA